MALGKTSIHAIQQILQEWSHPRWIIVSHTNLLQRKAKVKQAKKNIVKSRNRTINRFARGNAIPIDPMEKRKKHVMILLTIVAIHNFRN